MIVKKLSQIANRLQSIGLEPAADQVDLVLKVYAENDGTLAKVELSKPDAISVLKHHGIEYVKDLGGGTQGKVYQGRLGQQNVAVKINLPEGYYEGMKDSEKERRVGYEGKVWNSIKDIKDSGQLAGVPMGKSEQTFNASSHLPQIFGNRVVSANESPINQPYGILIMELLEPLKMSREELHRIFKAPKLQNADEGLIAAAAQKAGEAFPLSVAGRFAITLDADKATQIFVQMSKSQQIFLMHEKEKSDFPNTEKYLRRLLPILRQALNNAQVFKAVEHPYNAERSLEEVYKLLQESEDFEQQYIDEIKNKIDEFITNFVIYISSSLFPRDYFHLERDEHSDLQNQQLQELLLTLKHLRGLGVNWRDVRPENIMVRPSTGELVIIDVGLYELAK